MSFEFREGKAFCSVIWRCCCVHRDLTWIGWSRCLCIRCGLCWGLIDNSASLGCCRRHCWRIWCYIVWIWIDCLWRRLPRLTLYIRSLCTSVDWTVGRCAWWTCKLIGFEIWSFIFIFVRRENVILTVLWGCRCIAPHEWIIAGVRCIIPFVWIASACSALIWIFTDCTTRLIWISLCSVARLLVCISIGCISLLIWISIRSIIGWLVRADIGTSAIYDSIVSWLIEISIIGRATTIWLVRIPTNCIASLLLWVCRLIIISSRVNGITPDVSIVVGRSCNLRLLLRLIWRCKNITTFTFSLVNFCNNINQLQAQK